MKDAAGEVIGRIVIAIFGVIVLMFSFIVLVIMNAAREAQQTRRREAMAAKAQELKLTYKAEKHASFAHEYGFLDKLWSSQGGDKQSCINIITGEHGSNSVTLFDYYYTTDANKVWWWAPSWETHCYLSFIIVNMSSNFPELTIAKEGFFSKIIQPEPRVGSAPVILAPPGHGRLHGEVPRPLRAGRPAPEVSVGLPRD